MMILVGHIAYPVLLHDDDLGESQSSSGIVT